MKISWETLLCAAHHTYFESTKLTFIDIYISLLPQMLQFTEATLANPLTMYAMHNTFLPEAKRNAAVAAYGKVKSIEALGLLEAVMSDGRKHISGDTFNAAGAHGHH